jgi:hypothetical protein
MADDSPDSGPTAGGALPHAGEDPWAKDAGDFHQSRAPATSWYALAEEDSGRVRRDKHHPSGIELCLQSPLDILLMYRHCLSWVFSHRKLRSDDEDEIRISIEAVKETLRSDYFRHDEAIKARALVEQRGRYASSTGWKSASTPVKASTGRRWITSAIPSFTFLTNFIGAMNAC